MNKMELAKKCLSPKDYEVWFRTQLKLKNSFPKIAKDFWVSKQAIHKKYYKIAIQVNKLFFNQKKDEF